MKTDIELINWRASIDDMRYIVQKFPDGKYHPDYIEYSDRVFMDCKEEHFIEISWFLDEEALKIIREENNYKGDEEE